MQRILRSTRCWIPDQKQFLADLGDSIQQAFYPSAVLDTFAAVKYYMKRFITIPGQVLILFINIPPILHWQNTIFHLWMWARAMVIIFLILMAPMAKCINLLLPVAGVKQGNYEAGHDIWSLPKNNR